jgi:hypothetical protein
MDLEQFHTVVHVVCVSSFKIIMYKEHCIFLQTKKEKYAFSCKYACIRFNLNVLFVKCSTLFSFSSIFQMLMAH